MRSPDHFSMTLPGVGGPSRPPCRRTWSPSHDVPVQEHMACMGWGVYQLQALGWAGPQGGPGIPCQPPPPGGARPVPSWLPHGGQRGMGRVISRPSRRGWTGSPPRLRVSPGGNPPWLHPHTTVRSRAPGRPWGYQNIASLVAHEKFYTRHGSELHGCTDGGQTYPCPLSPGRCCPG